MKFRNKFFRALFFAVIGAFVLSASMNGQDTNVRSGSVEGQDTKSGMKGVRFPLEVYDDGTLKTMVIAGKIGDVMKEGFVEGEDVKFKSFTKEGVLDIVMKADSCRYNKDKGVIKSDSNIVVEKEGVRITGVGFEWASAKEIVEIKSNVRVVFSREVVKK